MRSKIRVQPEKLSAASRRSYGVPDFWEDQDLKCRTCGASFPFTAEMQKDWYERQQRHICQEPVLCPRCFFEHSQRRRLKSRMDYALRALQKSATEQTKLEAAETIIAYFQREKRGDICLALHLLREVLRATPHDRRVSELARLAESLQST